MKRTSLIVAGLLSLAGFAAHAETPDRSGQFAITIQSTKSRADVLAELKEAQRTGDIQVSGEGGTAYERNPGAYPSRTQVAGKTREQVRAETLQAVRDGDIAYGEAGLTRREVFPQRYMARGDAGWRQWTAGTVRPSTQR
jgi:hypothetical protein